MHSSELAWVSIELFRDCHIASRFGEWGGNGKPWSPRVAVRQAMDPQQKTGIT